MALQAITVEQARQKLGKRGEQMTDKQVNDLLIMLHTICNKAIDAVIADNE